MPSQIEDWFSQSHESNDNKENYRIKSIIAPHAGLMYSGSTAAAAYKCLQPKEIKRIFLLGPAHHLAFTGIGLPTCSSYRTPNGDIKVDQEICSSLALSGDYKKLIPYQEENEHSLELHLPFIYLQIHYLPQAYLNYL